MPACGCWGLGATGAMGGTDGGAEVTAPNTCVIWGAGVPAGGFAAGFATGAMGAMEGTCGTGAPNACVVPMAGCGPVFPVP
jgi:hypothetical protein